MTTATIERTTVSVPSGTLLPVLTNTVAMLAKRPPLPIMQCVLIGDGRVAVFDYETAVTTTMPELTGMPTVLAPGRALLDAVKAQGKKSMVTFTVADGRLVVSGDGPTVTLDLLPLDDYPQLPEPAPIALTVSGDNWRTLASTALAAVGKDETLPTLTGVRFDVDTTTVAEVSVCATDRYRLASATVPVITHGPVEGFLLPSYALAYVLKLVGKADTPVSVSSPTGVAGRRMLTIITGDTTIVTSLLDGEFPKWRSLIPTDTPNSVTLDRATLLAAVKALLSMCERNTPISLLADDTSLTLSTASGATQTLPAATHGPVQVAFNPHYLSTLIAATTGDRVTVQGTVASRPWLVTGDHDGVILLIMPVRLTQ